MPRNCSYSNASAQRAPWANDAAATCGSFHKRPQNHGAEAQPAAHGVMRFFPFENSNQYVFLLLYFPVVICWSA
jgi:hypothetical protein